MKHLNLFKTLSLVALLGSASIVQGQNYHPYAFGTMGGVYGAANYYADYVGLNVLCTAPASVAGSLLYTTPGGTGTGTWGGVVTTPLVDVPLMLPPLADSCGCSALAPGSMTGKIAVIWRGPISAPCEFGAKAAYAQAAGAVAVILINEYPGEGPIGMAAGAAGGGVTIPVFMIGNIPGAAIDAALDAGSTVTMTISPWGIGAANDLGFVPGGIAGWDSYAVPADQLSGSSSPAEYLGLDGAFIANYGTNPATNVRVSATLKFNGTTVHTDTTGVLTSFSNTNPATDSVMALFVPTLYNLNAPSTGRFDLTYNILSDSTDGTPANNTMTTSFYASDSVYSKGTYDFTNNVPLSTFPTGPNGGGDFVWGNMYHVNHGGKALSAVQFSMNNGFAGPLSNTVSGVNVFVFKWTDGSAGQPHDSIVQSGELDCISLAAYAFQDGDTSSTIVKTNPLGQLGSLGDSIDGTYRGGIFLEDNSNYYVAVDVLSGLTLYCDGQLDAYPRVFGRVNNANSFWNYSNFFVGTDFIPSVLGGGSLLSDGGNPAEEFLPLAFGNSANIDSFNYNSMKGLIPSVALTVIATPPTYISAVNTVNSTSVLSVYPVPTSENLTVSLNLNQLANSVTYTILDGLGRYVTKTTHNNVLSDKFDISTTDLKPGYYFLIVNANGRAMSRKFIVTK